MGQVWVFASQPASINSWSISKRVAASSRWTFCAAVGGALGQGFAWVLGAGGAGLGVGCLQARIELGLEFGIARAGFIGKAFVQRALFGGAAGQLTLLRGLSFQQLR